MIYNEEINAARSAVRESILAVMDFSGCDEAQAISLLKAILKVEGCPPEYFGEDRAVWDAVRRRV